MRALALLLCLTACATGPERRELERGAGVRPLPARPQPRVGPSFQPHTVPLLPQPNPRPTRLLPQTPETRRQPGIWAASTPSPWWTTREPTLLGATLPYPPVSAERDTWSTRLCAARADAVREQIMRPDDERALTGKDKACLAARLYLLCAEAMEANISSDHARGEMKDHGLQSHLADVTAAAKRMKTATCAEPDDDASITRWLERFAERWDRTQV